MRKPYAAIIAGLAVILILALFAPSVLASDGNKPVIYYVSPINRISGTYIYIYGANLDFPHCPGYSPRIANGGYSGWVTRDFSIYCAFGIADLNQGWEAGYQNEGGGGGSRTVDDYTFSGYSYIGLVGAGPYGGPTFSDSLITFTGFGNALPNYPLALHIHNGDKILVAIFTPGGTAWAVTTYTGPSL
jgi:hypothetical protein